MRYKPANWIVETHYAKDIFCHDFGPDEMCSARAVERMLPLLAQNALREIRVWHGGSLYAKYEAKV